MIIEVYLKTGYGVNAKAEYDSSTNVCIVKKNSIVASDISEAPTFRSKNSVKNQRARFVKNGVVTRNVEFKSSSSASNFVTGRSTNGMLVWKDKEGLSLKNSWVENTMSIKINVYYFAVASLSIFI